MLVLEVLAAVGILFGVAAVATGRGALMAPAPPDRAPVDLPSNGPLSSADLGRLRFSVAFRGYRMDEVDDVLDRLADEISDREARLAELSSRAEGRTAARQDSTDVDADRKPAAGDEPEEGRWPSSS